MKTCAIVGATGYTGQELLRLRIAVDEVHVSEALQRYILALVRETRVRAGDRAAP